MVASTRRRWALARSELPSRESIQQAEIQAGFGRVVAFRAAVVPLAALLVAGVVSIDPDPWRVWAGVLGVVVMGAISVGEYARERRGWAGPYAVPSNFLAMLGMQAVLIFGTGGLNSPALPIFLPMALMGGLLFGASTSQAAVLAFEWSLFFAFAVGPIGGWLPDPRLDPLITGPLDPVWLYTQAAVLVVMTTVATGAGVTFRGMFLQMVGRALQAREAEREAHAEHARELAALSGEIAHELKNPLASIKGLAQLLARDLDGKPAERLGVLRGEVDRMQEIVQEFLDFSRPLVPLAQAETDLVALAEEVATLQEGFARDRAVRVDLEPQGAVSARCDRRKVRQILVNLVQNAIEASPAGAEVVVTVGSDGRLAHLEVLDRGPGAPKDVAIFDAGVTTKAQGSGLGLTIARSLARQHGGDLDLLDRAGGGARAILRLPLAGASTSSPVAAGFQPAEERA